MKRREFEELKLKPEAELRKLLKESRDRILTLRFDLAAGKVKNVKELRVLRKSVARILTLLRAQADAT